MELKEDQARARFVGVPVVRLATADNVGQPHIVVTTFAVAENMIFSAVDGKPKWTRELKRLRNIRVNPRVSVLADHYEDDWIQLWWARADGTAAVLETENDITEPIRLLSEKYGQYRQQRPEGPVIAVAVDRWIGWAYAH
jgi:PPOX class probable F420-dependent enzyme